MSSIAFIGLVTIIITLLVALMVVVTLSIKAIRRLNTSWYERHYKRIEPALERFILTGEDQSELLLLRSWQRDLFLSRLIVKRIVLLRGAGQESLMRLAADLGLVDRYLKALKSRRRWRRARAAENLGYFGGERAVKPLGKLLSDKDETIRAVAARALAHIGSQGAVELLVQALNDPAELTRLRAAENLERLGDLTVKPLSEMLLALGTEGALMATRVLGNLRAREARPVLSSALLYTWSEDVKAQSTLALGKIGNPDDVPLILGSAKSSSWPVRAQAANALGLIGDVSTIPALKELGTDAQWWVRLNAARALANMGPEGERALLDLLQGDDRYARDQAAATLEARGITRRMVRQLAKPGQRGEYARTTVKTIIRSGATKYLGSLAETLPEGEERQMLSEMLAATEEVSTESRETEAEQVNLIETDPRAVWGSTESVSIERTSVEPLGAEAANMEPGESKSEGNRQDEPRGGEE